MVIGDPVLDRAIGRSSKFLRTSTLLMALVVMLAAVVMTYLEHAWLQQRTDFETNTNLRVVSVTHKESSQGPYSPLDFADAAALRASLDRSLFEGQPLSREAVISERFEFGTGIQTSDGRTLFVYGADPGLGPALGVERLQDGVGYTAGGADGATELQVPVVVAKQDGYESKEIRPEPLAIDSNLDPQRVGYLLGGRADSSVFVTTTTFQRIAQTMFATDWDTIQREWTQGQLSMTPLIGGIYLYLPRIEQVEPAARAVQGDGYATVHGLQAFDDLTTSLQRSSLFGGLLAGLLVAAAIGYMVLAWRGYLRLSRRDIGILKHWGLPESRIRSAYARRLARTCLVALAACAVTAIASGLVAFGPGRGVIIGLANAGIVGLLLGLVWKIAATVIIRRQVTVDVLTLLKRDREFQ